MALAYAGSPDPIPITFSVLEPTDFERLRRFYDRLSPETLYRRFLTQIQRCDQVHPDALLAVDHDLHEAVIALWGDEIVGVARYVRRSPSGAADLAVTVADQWQRQGLATEMCRRLGALATARGIEEFSFTMFSENRAALGLLRRLVRAPSRELFGAVTEGTVATTPAGYFMA